nr:tubby-related protein 1-like isoform X1 [Ipomoea batatas]
MLIDLEALKPFGLDETMDRLVIVPEWRHLLFDFKEDIHIDRVHEVLTTLRVQKFFNVPSALAISFRLGSQTLHFTMDDLSPQQIAKFISMHSKDIHLRLTLRDSLICKMKIHLRMKLWGMRNEYARYARVCSFLVTWSLFAKAKLMLSFTLLLSLEVANKRLAETSKLLEVAKVSHCKIIATWEVERKKHAEELVRVVSLNKGQYKIQRDLYATLRRQDKGFDPVSWGLPAELGDPEAQGRRLSVQAEEGRVETNADAGLPHVSPLATTSSHVGGNLHEHPDEVPTPRLENIHILDDKPDLEQ